MSSVPPTTALIARLFKGYIFPYLPQLVLATVFMIIAAVMTGAQAKMMEPIIDEVFKQKDMLKLYMVGGTILVVFAVRAMATYWQTIMMNKIGQKMVSDVQRDLYTHIIRADLAFFHANSSGGLVSRVINDVGVMRYAMAECFTGIIRSALTLLILVVVMFMQDWKLALAAFFVFPVSSFLVARLSKSIRRNAVNVQAELATFSNQLQQTFQGIRQVKAYGREGHEGERVIGRIRNVYRLVVSGFRLGSISSPVTEVLSGLAIVAVIVYGGTAVIHGESTPGKLFSFMTAFILAYDPIKRLAKLNTQLQNGLAASGRVFEMMDIKPVITDKPDAKTLAGDDTSLAFDAVKFHYPDGTQALNGLSLKVPAGRSVAIVGSSGAGKSTILNLILRFYDVSAGRVLVGGQDVRDITMESLRDHIALVSQEVMLFDDTVKANIAYGLKDASDEAIKAAAESAFASGFIEQLPQGYDTLVGENGVKLSGGQRQRIAIARAMLRNAPILLLDEATSALDNESERAVQAALKKLQQGRTTIVVAHRLSTIMDSDWIYVLERGAVAEEGRHEELLKRGGTYARLYGQELNDASDAA